MRKKRGLLWKLSNEEFAGIIARNTGLGDALLAIGYKARSGSLIKEIRSRIVRDELNTNHFHRAKTIIGRSIPLPLVLVENSTYVDRQRLKRRLIEAGKLQDVCAVCGLPPIWQGKEIILQLDHINGTPSDNRLENLRVICPNCHTQTSTFCGRGKAQQSNKPSHIKQKPPALGTCAFCGGQFVHQGWYKKIYCSQKCYGAASRKVERPNAEKLQQLVTKYPVTTIAKHFGVSDRAVAKWCKRAGITPPSRGYWAKVQAGRDPAAEQAKCLVCGKPAVRGKRKYCSHACADRAACNDMMPTEKELARLVARMPLSHVAKRFCVSPPTVARWCKRLGVILL